MKILFADDNPAICSVVAAKLRNQGHEVVVASNGEEAWQLLKNSPIDLLVSDWDMPVLDGLNLCRRIRQNTIQRYIYVILCTAKSEKQDFIVGMDAGADDFVVKPIDFAELGVRIRAGQRVLQLQTELANQNRALMDVNLKLSSAYATIETDLKAAAATQLSLLPQTQAIHPSVRLDWLFIPSRFLAGDMLNYFMADQQKLAFYQLDVSGHGIPSALLSVTLSRFLLPNPGSPTLQVTPQGTEATPPASVVEHLNREFQNTGDNYFTITYGWYDVLTREVRFCQGGSPRPILIPRSGTVEQIGRGGFPVGLVPVMQYDEETIQLQQGDRLILFSDGITECASLHGKRYSELLLLDLLRENRDLPLTELVASVKNEMEKWNPSQNYSDDLSLLALEAV